MKLKLDLHTHPLEAMRLSEPTLEGVERLVKAVQQAGLDGIGITEHWNYEHSFRVKEMVEDHFDNAILVIPGWEIDSYPHEVVELFLPDGSVWRPLAHPGDLSQPVECLPLLHGIEVENGGHNWHIPKEQVRRYADEHDLLLMQNSDAHYLEKLGTHYNEVEIEELMRRARNSRSSMTTAQGVRSINHI